MKTATDYSEEALVLLKIAKLDEAAKLYLHVLSLDPNFTKAYNNLGIIYKLQGRLEDAESNFQKALELNPKLVPVYSNLANIYRIKGEIKKAEEYCRKAIKLDPGFADAYNNLGALMQVSGKPKEAIKSYRRAIKLAPSFDDAYSNLAGALQTIGRLDEATRLCIKAVKLDWENPDPYYNLGNILKSKGQLAHAVKMYERVIELSPDFSDAYDQLIDTLRSLCEWKKLKKYTTKLDQITSSALSKNLLSGETPFNAVISHDLPERNLKIAKLWGINISTSAKTPPFKFDSDRIGVNKLRVGYVSGDFTDHPVAHLSKSMFARHDRKNFEIFCYSFGKGDKKRYREQIKKGCDKFRDIDKLSFEEAAKQIYKDKIDILVDLMGYTSGNRFEIFAKRPSPIQVSYLGFPGSTGADFIDYAIVDKVLVQKGQDLNYSEKLIYIPNCYQVNDSEQKISTKNFKRLDFDLPADAFVFASFNRVSKITPKMFNVWMNILKAVPKSILWLRETIREAEDNLKKEARKKGVNPKRIIFGKILDLDEHLKRLTLADLMLDSYPYSGGATTSHALRMGVPVITLEGKTYVSRMSASLLNAMGLKDLATISFKEYERLAINLAKNPKKLNALRLTLNANKKSFSLFDTAKFVENLEKAYQKIWQAYLGERG